jgi:hypothetical protein
MPLGDPVTSSGLVPKHKKMKRKGHRRTHRR